MPILVRIKGIEAKQIYIYIYTIQNSYQCLQTCIQMSSFQFNQSRMLKAGYLSDMVYVLTYAGSLRVVRNHLLMRSVESHTCCTMLYVFVSFLLQMVVDLRQVTWPGYAIFSLSSSYGYGYGYSYGLRHEYELFLSHSLSTSHVTCSMQSKSESM